MTVHITNTLEPAAGEDKIVSIMQIYFRDEGGKESGSGVIGYPFYFLFFSNLFTKYQNSISKPSSF